ncbi:MAG: methyltransferase domain-containing protein [Eubacteriaceae bacterium]|nr:methyltransferase domain-containing protein [Eubacteriaceae bacterium]
MKPIINWEALQSINRPPMPSPAPDYNWDNSADMYHMMAEMERTYTYNQLNCFDTSSDDTVLDIGCGPGRVTCIMAERAKSVTALDMFPKMLAYCTSNAKARGLTNVNPILMDWNDAQLGGPIQKHDIVIASRSVGMQDVMKLNAFANKYIVLIAWANAQNIPSIQDEMFAGTSGEGETSMPGRFEDRRVGYNTTWNMVYDMGFDPNIRIVRDGFTKDFRSHDEAYAWLRQIRPFHDQYLPVFKKNLEPMLSENGDGTVTFRKETRSYVIWFEPIAIEG